MDIRGRDGVSLAEVVARRAPIGGAPTNASRRLPDYLFMTGPGSPSVLGGRRVRISASSGWRTAWPGAISSRSRPIPQPRAPGWRAHVNELAYATLPPAGGELGGTWARTSRASRASSCRRTAACALPGQGGAGRGGRLCRLHHAADRRGAALKRWMAAWRTRAGDGERHALSRLLDDDQSNDRGDRRAVLHLGERCRARFPGPNHRTCTTSSWTSPRGLLTVVRGARGARARPGFACALRTRHTFANRSSALPQHQRPGGGFEHYMRELAAAASAGAMTTQRVGESRHATTVPRRSSRRGGVPAAGRARWRS